MGVTSEKATRAATPTPTERLKPVSILHKYCNPADSSDQ